MKLELESGTVIDSATEADIRSHVPGQAFAILSETADSYVQCAKQEYDAGDSALESQDGSLAQHFSATADSITVERVIAAFIAYLHREPSWRNEFNWERVEV